MPFIPLYVSELGVRDVGEIALWSGLVLGATPTVTAISAPLWGRFSDRYGRRPALLVGLLISAVAYVIFAYASTISLLLLSRIVQGFGGGTIGVVQAYVADASDPNDRAKSLGWLSAATSLGAVVGPNLVTVTGELAHSWGIPRLAGPFLLAGILNDRLRVRLREKLGEAYAPEVTMGYTNCGGGYFLTGIVRIAPGHERRVLDACGQEIADLCARGPAADEFERARKPLVARIEAERQTNQRWIDELSRLHCRPDALAECAGLPAMLRALTVDDVRQAAAKLLRPEAISTLILRPEPAK